MKGNLIEEERRNRLGKLVALVNRGMITVDQYKEELIKEFDLPDMELGGMLLSESREKDKLFKAIRDEVKNGVLI